MTAPHLLIEQLSSFSPDDAARIRQLAAKLGNHSKPLTDENLKEILATSTTSLLVAREQETQKITGMVTLAVYRIPYVKKAHLDDLIVDEDYRGQGIGSLLLDKALSMAKEFNATYVDFTSRPERVDGNRLYEKLGFQKRDTNVYRLIFDYAEKQ